MKKLSKLSKKIVFMFLLVTVLVSAAMGFTIYRIVYSDALSLTEKRLVRICTHVSTLLDPADLDRWLSSDSDGNYQDARLYLQAMSASFDLPYMFVYRPVPDGSGGIKDEVEFIFDINSGEDDRSRVMSLGEHLTGVQEIEYLREVVSTGKYQVTENLTSRTKGKMVFAFYPVTDDEGKVCAIIGAGSTKDRTRGEVIREIIGLLAIYCAFMAAFVIILLAFMRRNVTKPVNLLSERMNNFVSDYNEMSYIPVTEIKTKDEIQQMAEAYNKMSESIIKYTNDIMRDTAEKEHMKADLDVARSIRSATSAELTFPAFPERRDFELYASLKNTVFHSCSFCNYILSDEDHLYIAIGESVGNSLPAMLMSMLASTNIKCLAKMGYPPYRIAAETNDQLCAFEHTDNSLNVSILIAEIELSTGELRYVNAGMPPLMIKRPGERYEPEKPVMQFDLGEMRRVSFEQEQMTLSQGSTLIFTSYGVSEMRSSENERFTVERLTDEINQIASEKYSLSDMTDELEKRLDSFRGGSENERDTTIVGFRYFG